MVSIFSLTDITTKDTSTTLVSNGEGKDWYYQQTKKKTHAVPPLGFLFRAGNGGQ